MVNYPMTFSLPQDPMIEALHAADERRADALEAQRAKLYKIAIEEGQTGEVGEGWSQIWDADGFPVYVDTETGEPIDESVCEECRQNPHEDGCSLAAEQMEEN